MSFKFSAGKKSLQIFVMLSIFAATNTFINAQTQNIVDESFDANLLKPYDTAFNVENLDFIIHPDGKTTVLYEKGIIVRYNQDGSVDSTFKCNVCSTFSNIKGISLQTDGKILISGTDLNLPNSKIVRLNSTGTVDSSFTQTVFTPSSAEYITSAKVWAVQPDGKIFAVIEDFCCSSGLQRRQTLYRFNADGSIDNSFQTIMTGDVWRHTNLVKKLVVMPDGKFYISGSFYSLARFNADGTRDTTFEIPNISIFGGGDLVTTARINDFEFRSDGKIIIAGFFDAINGVPRKTIARLNPTGSLDTSFEAQISSTNVEAMVEQLPNNSLLLSNIPTSSLILLTSEGLLDNSFTTETNVRRIKDFEVDSSGKIVFLGFYASNSNNVVRAGRLNSTGSLDVIFDSIIDYGVVLGMALQSNGKAVISGRFRKAGGVAVSDLVRLNAGASTDTVFNFPADITIRSMPVIQNDGKVLLGADYGLSIYLRRFNNDGTVDTTFNPRPNDNIIATAVQNDGKILISGAMSNVDGVSQSVVARLNADGSLDTTFRPVFSGGAAVFTIVPQTDGKVMAGGLFSSVNGFNRAGMVRLNADGTVDLSFNSNGEYAKEIILLPDGKYLVKGDKTVTRHNSDGTRDNNFQLVSVASLSSTDAIKTMALLPDGSVLIGGNFYAVNGKTRNNLARLLPDGRLELSFGIWKINGDVNKIVVQSDNKILVGGSFSHISGVGRAGLARLNYAPSVIPSSNIYYDFDGDGRDDISVYRPSAGAWYLSLSNNNAFRAENFGIPTDIPVSADYDGDGKADIAVWRAGSFAYFYILQSSTNTLRTIQFGTTGDDPTVVGDWDGDGKADAAVYRNGAQSRFYFRPTNQPAIDFTEVNWGTDGDRAVRGDFTGDGKLDAAVFRPSTGIWYIFNRETGTYTSTHFGLATDKLTAADYDGDGKTDIAVFRPSNGSWYRINSSNNTFFGMHFGIAEDKPVPADYDGDGKNDIAVYRPSTGSWYQMKTQQGFGAVLFGAPTDIPVPNIPVK